MPSTLSPAPVELGSRFRTVQSQAPSIAFSAGNTVSVELPRSFLYKMIRCRLRGSITIGTGTTGINEAPLGLIKRIDLIADGRKLLHTVNGQHAFRLSNLFNGFHGEFLAIAQATGQFSATFDLHNEAARMLTPIMSYFDPRPYEKVELRVQWGTLADVLASVGTATLGADVGLDIQIVQSAEGSEQIGFNRLLFFDEAAIAAAPVSNFTFNVPRAGLLAGIMLSTYTANLPSNAFFQSPTAGQGNIAGQISLKSDNNFLHLDNLNPTELQADNVGSYALYQQVGTIPSAGTIPASVPGIAGYYFIDLTEDGLATSLLNTFDLNVLQLIISSFPNASGAWTIRPTYIFYEPITAA